MKQVPAVLMRIYISSTDKIDHKPLYEAIVFFAKQNGLQGATVLKGVMGFGASSHIISASMWEVTEKLPIVVEIIDQSDKINLFADLLLPMLEKSEKGFMVTYTNIEIAMQGLGKLR